MVRLEGISILNATIFFSENRRRFIIHFYKPESPQTGAPSALRFFFPDLRFLKFLIVNQKLCLERILTRWGTKVVAACVASSGGHSTLLLILKHIYNYRLNCSLGCTFCTWHFTSSSSVKCKLKTIPEGHHLEKSFFLDSSWIFFTKVTVDEIPLMINDWWC